MFLTNYMCDKQIKKYYKCLKNEYQRKGDCEQEQLELSACLASYNLSRKNHIENNQIPSVVYKHNVPVQKSNH